MSGGDGIFRIRRGPDVGHHISASVGVLSKADLDKPSCPSCFRPVPRPGYCVGCEERGAAALHRKNNARRGGT